MKELLNGDWSPESRLRLIQTLTNNALQTMQEWEPLAETATILYLQAIDHLTRQPAEWLEANKGLIEDCLEDE